MSSRLLFNPDSVAMSCLLVYRIGGMPQVLHYLLDIIRAHTPCVRLNALFCAWDCSSLVCMADTRSAPIPNKYVINGVYPAMVEREKMTEVVHIEDLEPYKTPELKKIAWRNDIPFLHHHSLLRLPLFKTGNSVFVINFWGDESGVFSLEDVPILYKSLMPLSEELLSSLSGINILSSPPPAASGLSGTEKVKMCPGLGEVEKMAYQASRWDSAVLIQGETGAGKECVADMIHSLSKRSKGPFIKVNCGALSENLLDSELFGHEKGSFTGAISSRAGCFEMASGGTLFLDEIGDMSLAAQVKLLRVLDNGIVRRVGGTRFFSVDTRIIAATNKNLSRMIEDGTFREDLWYRLSTLPVEVPPLRKRLEDIPILTRHFIQEKSRKMDLIHSFHVGDKELHSLYYYDWPGNVRELEHVVERAMLENVSTGVKADLVFKLGRKHRSGQIENEKTDTYWPTLEEYENQYIRKVLDHCHGKLTGRNSATSILDIHFTTLKSKMRKMGLNAG